MDLIFRIFDTDGFPPRWRCGSAWVEDPTLGWIHICSDVATWLAYLLIPCVLAYYVIKKKDVSFPRVFWLFCAFILACGTVHLLEAVIFWSPVYRLSAVFKVITAVTSVATVIALARIAPVALTLPGLAELNSQLSKEIDERKSAEQKLLTANAELQTALEKAEAAESTVRESEAILRGVFDNSRSFIGLMSRDGVLLDANRTSLMAAGVPAENVLNKPFWKAPWWSHSEELQQRLRQAISRAAAGEEDSFEATHPTGEGTTLDVDFSLSPIRSDSGEVLYLVPEGRNITERKNHERKLENTLAQLEESNIELEQFAYVASHDLRSPLRGISLIAAFLREDEGENLSASSLDYLGKLDTRILRMQTLLDDLLSYSRVGHSNGKLEHVDVRTLVDDALEMTSIPDGFEVSVSEEMPSFRTYPTPLRHVFLNLIQNSAKHHVGGEQGCIEIGVSENEEFYEFYVADTGPGIEEQYHEDIFDMFKTLQSRDDVEGSGMGLAIVRKLVRHCGGDISVQSTPGEGATFRFVWPKLHAEA